MREKMSEQKLVETCVLFIGNIPYSLTDNELHQFSAEHGDVIAAAIVRDERQRSRGFGFVRLVDTQAAQAAVVAMHGKELQGRTIRVSLADNNSRYLSLL